MIRDISINDENDFNRLGFLINDSFLKTYNLKKELEKSYTKITVYELDSNIVAFLHVENLDEETSVINIIVDPNFRRKHIADALIIDMLKSNVSKKIVLEVNENNEAAIKLYEKHGFIKKGIRKGYYNGVNAITMVKTYE